MWRKGGFASLRSRRPQRRIAASSSIKLVFEDFRRLQRQWIAALRILGT
jgi:hypothetical protein